MARVSKRRSVKNNKKPKKKRRIFRKILLTFFILVVITIGGGIAVFYATDPQILVDAISKEMYTRYSRELKIKHIKLSLLKGIHLEGIRLSPRGGFKKGRADIEFKEGSVIYNPVALLFGELGIIKISIGGFSTTYPKLMRVVDDFTKDLKPQKEKPKPKEEQKKRFSLFKFKVHFIEIFDAKFKYNNVWLNVDVTVAPKTDIDKSRISMLITSKYGRIKFDGTPGQGVINIYDLKVANFVEGGGIDATVNRLQAVYKKVSENSISLNGKIVDIDFMGFKINLFSQFIGTYSIKGQSLIIRDLGLKVNNSRLFIERLAYQIPRNKLAVTISSMNLKLSDFMKGANANISGKIDFTFRKKIYLSSADIKVSNIQYEFIKKGGAKLNAKDNAISGNMDLQVIGGNIALKLKSQNIANSAINITMQADKFDIVPLMKSFEKSSKKDAAKKSDSKPMDFKLPLIKFKGTIKTLVYEKYIFKNAYAEVSYRNSVINLDKLTMSFIRGTLTANAKMVGKYLSGNMTFRDGKLRELTKMMLEKPKKLYGTVNMTASFKLDMHSFLASTARLKMELKNGEIRNFVIQEEISQVLYNMPLDDIPFDNIAITAEMHKKSLNLKKFEFVSEDIRISANGDVNLKTKGVNIATLASFSDDFLSGLPNISKLFTRGFRNDGRVDFRLSFGGTYEKPEFKLMKW